MTGQKLYYAQAYQRFGVISIDMAYFEQKLQIYQKGQNYFIGANLQGVGGGGGCENLHTLQTKCEKECNLHVNEGMISLK